MDNSPIEQRVTFTDCLLLRADRQITFPSNGKAYPKTTAEGLELPKHVGVSIPFKRESISKGSAVKESITVVSVSIPFKRESISKENDKKLFRYRSASGFNSLQTGKHIQSDFGADEVIE